MVVAIRLLLLGLLTFESIFQYFSPERIHLIVIGVVPALLWLTFFLVEERRLNREPALNIFWVFVLGIFAALTAFDAQTVLKEFVFNPLDINVRSPIGITVFAYVEEFLKFLFVYLAIHKSKYFDEPLDAMLDMITAAMGFAAFENVLFIISSGDQVAEVAIFRFIGALLLHAVASGFIGYYWAHRKIVFGVIVAGALHTLFNGIVLYSDNGILLAPLLLVFASFFLFKDFDIIRKEEEKN